MFRNLARLEAHLVLARAIANAGMRSAMLAALLVLGAAAAPAQAAGSKPVIESVVVGDSTLEIHGADFGLGGTPVVKLGAFPLAVQSSSSSKVTAGLPAGLPAGIYQLTVRPAGGGAPAKTKLPIAIERRIQTTSFAGQVGLFPGNAPNYLFTGQQTEHGLIVGEVVITRPNQRLIGSATASLGLEAGSPRQTADIGLCYQLQAGPIAAGPMVNFAGGAYVTHLMTTIPASYSATASAVIQTPGTYTVGMCIRNNGGFSALSENDYVNGWVMVVD